MCDIKIQQTLPNQGETLIHSEHTGALSPILTKMAVGNLLRYPCLFACHLDKIPFLPHIHIHLKHSCLESQQDILLLPRITTCLKLLWLRNAWADG